MNKPKPVKPRGKQHDMRAASFKRIAKALRIQAKTRSKEGKSPADVFKAIAAELDHEAELLRDMR